MTTKYLRNSGGVMKRIRIVIMLVFSIFILSTTLSFAGTPSIVSVQSNIPNLTGGRPLSEISTIDPSLTQDTVLNNKLDDPSHLPKFVVNDPYNTLEKVPSSHPLNTAENGAWRTRFTNKSYNYNDDSTYILIKDYFKFKGKWYDKKIILREINNQMSFYFGSNEVSFSSDTLFSTGSNWGEARVDTQILDKDGNKANIPNLMIGIDDIDFVNFPRESFRISNFVINANNAFVHKMTTYLVTSNGTVYGSDDSDDYRPVFFANTGIQNGEAKNMWYGTPRGAYSGCYISSTLNLRKTAVHYRANTGGEITGTKDDRVYLGDVASLSNTQAKANKNYKFVKWTPDRNIILTDGTYIPAGEEMTSEQVEKAVIDSETTFTAHFDKTVGSLKIVKRN